MIYLGCFFLVSVLMYFASKCSRRSNSVALVFLASTSLALLAFARSENVGIDVLVYVKNFCDLALSSDSFLDYLDITQNRYGYRLEIGYAVINFFAARIGGLHFIMGLSNFIFVYPMLLKINSLKDKLSVPLATLIFLLVFYNMSLNLVRQCIAMGIIVWASGYLEKGRRKVFLAFTLAACLFHVSAVVALAYLAIDYSLTGRLSLFKRLLLMAMLLLFITNYDAILTLLAPLFGKNSSKLGHMISASNGHLSSAYILIKILAVVIVVAAHQKENGKTWTCALMMVCFDLVLYFLTGLNGNAFRYGLYFGLFVPLALGYCICRFPKKIQGVLGITVIGAYIAFWCVDNLIGDSYGTIPYEFGF